MHEMPSQPWNPDRQWADPLIATLALVILLLIGGQARMRHAAAPRPDTAVTLQGRLQDLVQAAPTVLGPLSGPILPRRTAALDAPGIWDQALAAVQAAEDRDPDRGEALLSAAKGEGLATFRRTWIWAYRGTGSTPTTEELRKVRAALGDGYSARLLEARVRARAGEDPRPLEQAARAWAQPRLLGMAGVALGGMALTLAGLGFAFYLLLSRPRPVSLPAFGLSGRALLLVMLGWFTVLLCTGTVVGTLVSLAPFLRPVALPLAYGLHAALGTRFLCAAEGVDLRTLWRRLTAAPLAPALAQGLGFFALALAAVLAVAMAMSPLARHAEPPQKELLQMLSGVHGPWTVVILFLTVAVLAPAFEELMFRGLLLPWLGPRLAARMGSGRGWALAVAITGVTFGAMHMQPLGLPTLSTLGFVLGFAFVRTGNLGAAILVHGLWNGGVFILMRALT